MPSDPFQRNFMRHQLASASAATPVFWHGGGKMLVATQGTGSDGAFVSGTITLQCNYRDAPPGEPSESTVINNMVTFQDYASNGLAFTDAGVAELQVPAGYYRLSGSGLSTSQDVTCVLESCEGRARR